MSDEVYIFNLKMLCGGYAYFSTYTEFDRFSSYCREFRKPCTVSKERFYDAAKLLNHNPIKIENDKDFDIWLRAKGWAAVNKNYVLQSMSQWLKSKECLNSGIGIFTDIKIVSDGTLKRTYSGNKKQKILKRDGGKCIKCGSQEALTMEHIIPFSRGGETTSRNLVTLCEPCNQSTADKTDLSLFNEAGLPFHFDRELINDCWASIEQRQKAAEISDNLMQTRCDVW